MTDAKELTERLGGSWHRTYGTAPCPVCQPERRPDQCALTLANGGDGHLLAHCKKGGCSFADILAAAGIEGRDYSPPDPATLAQREAERRAEAEKRERQAKSVWAEAVPIRGTVAEDYLRKARGITCNLPDSLRFHPSCWHPSAQRLPAMVAAVEGAERFALHRTYLRPDGSGKAAVDPPRAMLGGVAGGAVRLSQGQDALAVAEGIETGLSLLCGPLCGSVAVWAALSTSGMAGLHLPSRPEKLIVASDGDAPGRKAGHQLAERSAALGWTVTLFPAPDGRDWNDVIRFTKGAAA